MTKTLSTRLPSETVTRFRLACLEHGVDASAIIGAFLESWTPLAPNHRPILPPEIRTLVTAARGRKS